MMEEVRDQVAWLSVWLCPDQESDQSVSAADDEIATERAKFLAGDAFQGDVKCFAHGAIPGKAQSLQFLQRDGRRRGHL